MAIPVKLPVFEGPLDLLMHLIEKNKIDIYDIPIAEITDQYLEYVRQMNREDMDVTSEFLVMAATLLDIKSRMLLPREKDEETGEEEGDPREELVRRLLEYKKYKYLSEELAVRREQAGVRFFREQHLPKEVRSYQPPIDYGELLRNVDLDSLEKVFGEVLRRKKSRRDPIRSGFGKIRRDEVNIDNKTLYIRAFLRSHPHTDFRALLESQESREEVIVTFLILLELMKNQKVHIVQDSIGGKILVELSETGHAEIPPEEPDSAEADPAETQEESAGLAETASIDMPTEEAGSTEAASAEAPLEESGSNDTVLLDTPLEDPDLSDLEPLETPIEEPDSAAAEPADALFTDMDITDPDTEAVPMDGVSGSFGEMQSSHTAGVALSALRRRAEVTAPLPPALAEEIPFPLSAVAEAGVPIPAAALAEADMPNKTGAAAEAEVSSPTAPDATEAETIHPAAAQKDPLLTTAVPEDEGTDNDDPQDAHTGTDYREIEHACTDYPEVGHTGTDDPADEKRTGNSTEGYRHFSARLWHGRSPRCDVAAAFSGSHSTGPCGTQQQSWPCRSLWERNRLSRLWARRRFR